MKLLEPLRRHPWKAAVVLLVLASAGCFAYLHRHDLSREQIIEYGKGIPAVWFIALFMIVPLAGFPVSICMVTAGIRFGFTGGMAVTAVGVFFHNFAAYRLTHGLFRARLRDFLERSGYAIPHIQPRHHIKFTAWFAAIHGPPYFAKLYLLALTDVPFRSYFWVGAPVYILFGAISVGIGSAVTTLDLKWISIVVGCLVILPLVSYVLRKRFRPAPD